MPGTTTVISASLGWGKEGLLHWAWSLGMDGRNFREERDKAANAGTIAHAMAEADILGRPVPDHPSDKEDPGIWALGRSAFDAYLAWRRMSRIKVVAAEVSFVSEELRFGGTLDGVGSFEDRIELIDFKTSNSTHPDHMIQLAAYRHLYEEGTPFGWECGLPRKVDGIHLIRFSKVSGSFHHSYYRAEGMEKPFRAFKLLREMYDLKKDIEEML